MDLCPGQLCKPAPSVHAEILANIQNISVVVKDTYTPDKYTITPTSLLYDQTPIIDFPAAVNIHDFKIQNVDADSFSFRLRLTSNISANVDVENKALLTSKNLKDISSISCKECHTSISHKAFLAVKDLPSEHWMELVECWICHETSDKEHSGQLKPIVAREKLLLVGSTYVLLHPNDVQNIKLDDNLPTINWKNVIASKWIPIICSSCNSALGEKQYHVSQHENGVSPNAQAIKLYKYAVAFQMANDSTDSLHSEPSFVHYAVMDFVELFSAHATYKFLICDRSDESIHGLLWVFNPDIQIYRQKSGSDCGWQRAMKVLYIDCQQDTMAAGRHIEKWKDDKSVDRLVYPGKYCRQLFAMLAESNLGIPDHLRRAPPGGPLADFLFAYLDR